MICETVKITVESEVEGSVTTVMPAYTRTYLDFYNVARNHLTTYMERSNGGPVSVGDFALYLVCRASEEPKEVE